MRRVLIVLFAGGLAAGCGDDAGTGPSGLSAVTIGTVTPAAGTVVTATGGLVSRDSGRIAIPITIQSGRDWTWAQLNVYLLSADGYCAQNMPDAPTWGPLSKGHRQTMTISGFQVFRDTCVVTGVRAMLHQRNNGLLTPPSASETIAEATHSVSWTILR